ncbi:MAG: ferrochelatase [Simkaniaceae bacterium]|nr:ferrochelatase [Simkaniaceae bacterium]
MADVGVLLVNLGTPDSTAPGEVKKYLIRFLSDHRVMDIPYLLRFFLVRAVIVPSRYRNCAKLYESVRMKEGLPLRVYGKRVAERLQESLGPSFRVVPAMRYRSPSIAEGLDRLRGVGRLITVPLFPQYASATTGSVHEEVFRLLGKRMRIPSLVCIDEFSSHPAFIGAVVASAEKYRPASYDHVLFSYHGLPERQVRKASGSSPCLRVPGCCERKGPENRGCYAAQCVRTTEAVCRALALPPSSVSHAYQSRLGRDPWLRPYTIDTVRELARAGKRRVLVFAPSFTADCLETLEEIGVQYAEVFRKAGGELLQLVEGLNDRAEWIDALKTIILEHLGGTKCFPGESR